MVKLIGFWREVQNSYGTPYQVVLKTFVAPDDASDSEALDDAIRGFCAWGHVARWDDLAKGYEIQCDVGGYGEGFRSDVSNGWHPTYPRRSPRQVRDG